MQFFLACLISLLLVTPSLAATISSTPLISGNLVDADKFPISRAGSGVAYTGDVGKLKNTIRPNEVVVGVDTHALTLVAANTDSDNAGKTIVLNSPVTTAGTSDGSAPDITGLVVGDTVVDGTVTWTLRSLTTAAFTSEGNL